MRGQFDIFGLQLIAVGGEVLPTRLKKLNQEYGKTIVMVTHDPHAAQYATRRLHLGKGAMLKEEALAA